MILQNGNPRVMGSNPASINLDTGVITINPFIWHRLEDWEKAIILLHEEGHYKNQTLSEIKADLHAIQKFAGTEQSSVLKLKETMFKFIPNTEVGQKRKLEFVKNLLYFDANANDNNKSQRILNDINTMGRTANFAVSTAITIASAALPLVGAIIAKYNSKYGGIWSNSDQKDLILSDYAFAAAYNIYAYYGGSDNHDQAIEMLDDAVLRHYSDPASLHSLIYELMKRSGLFNGDGRDNVKSNNTFWNSTKWANSSAWAASQVASIKILMVQKYIQDSQTAKRSKMVKVLVIGAIVLSLIFLKKRSKI